MSAFNSCASQEVASGAAQTTLETLQEILEELSQTNETHGHGCSDAGKKIIGSIKKHYVRQSQLPEGFQHTAI